MISKCANPACSNRFRHFGAGKLFPFEIKHPSEPCSDVPNAVCLRKPHHHTIFFWLCRNCAAAMTVHFDPQQGARVIPRELSPPDAQNLSGQ
jgi:hypothetical protein